MNYLTYDNGVRVFYQPSNPQSKLRSAFSPVHLIQEEEKKIWMSASGSSLPHQILFDL